LKLQAFNFEIAKNVRVGQNDEERQRIAKTYWKSENDRSNIVDEIK